MGKNIKDWHKRTKSRGISAQHHPSFCVVLVNMCKNTAFYVFLDSLALELLFVVVGFFSDID